MTQEQFLVDINTWSTHRPLLWMALEDTKGSVCEFGSGEGSTQYLRQYCQDAIREFFSFDNNKDWCEKTGSTYVEDWDEPELYKSHSVVLIDHAPGSHRHEAISIFANRAEIIVIHDSEPTGGGDYQLDKIWPLFRFRVHVKCEGAWATAVSNMVNIHSWYGREPGGYLISL